MKKQILKRMTSAFLAFVMVFLMMPLFTIGVIADDVSITNNTTYIQEYRMSSSNTSIKVTNYIQQREKKSGLTDSFNKSVKKTITFGKNIGSVLSIASMAVNEFQNDNPWYENVGNVALNLVSSYLGIDLFGGPSESEIMMEKLEEMMEEVNEKLDSLSESVDALSSEVQTNTASLAEYVYYTNKDDQLQRLMDEFTQRNNSNGFSYFRDRDNLNNAYKALMDEYIPIDGSTSGKAIEVCIYDDIVKTKYDDLYEAAMNLEPLYDYIVAEENGFIENKTVQDAFYEKAVLGYYLCSGVNKDESGNAVLPKDNAGNIILPDENIEIKCIDFAKEIYDTYMFSQYALMLCYNYQLEYLTNQTYDDGDEVLHHYYKINNIPVTFGEYIFSDDDDLGIVKKMLEEQDKVAEEIAGYICYVLNLDGSYLYESGAKDKNGERIDQNTVYNTQYKEIFEENSHETDPFSVTYGNFATKAKYIRLNNKVSNGDTLYMNVLPNDLASLFASGDFTFTTSDETVATVNNAGVVNVIGETDDTFRISMLYNNTVVYYMDFEIIDRLYSGGMGTEDCPYLISSWNDIVTLSTTPDHYEAKNIYFKLTNDIDGNSATFAGIPSFNGEWNGNDHRVYNFKIDTSGINNTGFFRVVESGASIKSFIIGHYDKNYTSYDNYSVYINGYLDCDGVFYVGGLCGANYGTISNCSLESVKVCGKIYWAGDNDISNVVGGIAGRNENNIDNCSVAKSFFYSNATAKKDGDASLCKAYTGGIVGKNIGYLKDSVSYSNHMAGYTYSKEDYGDAPGAYTYCGAMMGWLTSSATIENCFEQQNTFDAVADADDSDNDATNTGGIYAARDGNVTWDGLIPTITFYGNIINCTENSLGSWFISYTTGCPTKVTITMEPSVQVGGGTYADVLEYVCGEKYLQYSYTTGGSPAYATTTIHEYEMSVGRIDTSLIENQETEKTAIKLNPIKDTSTYTKEILTATITPEEIIDLRVYTPPKKLTYGINSSTIEPDGLQLVALYNNGNARFLNDGSDTSFPKEFTEEYDFSTLGETNITFSYDGKSVSVPVTVVNCLHENLEEKAQINPTCGAVGYEAGTYCNDCQSYISGGEQISATGNHTWSVWSKLDDSQHIHSCTCGASETRSHTWNTGNVTLDPTYDAVGEKTYTCTGCGATYTEEIPKLDIETVSAVEIDNKTAAIGGIVKVNISLRNNPGIASMKLNVAYDTALLELTEVAYNTAIGGMAQQPSSMNSPIVLNWINGTANSEGDFLFATLTFRVNDSVEAGTVSQISVTYDAEDIYDIAEQNIDFRIEGGTLTIVDYTPGDMNGDNEINNKDMTRLFQYLSGWDVEVDEAALDVNGDGDVNNKDLTRLFQYLSGWDVEIL